MMFLFQALVAVVTLLFWFTTRKMPAGRAEPGARVARLAALGVGLVSASSAAFQCVTVVPAGHVGVVDFFGIVSDSPLKAGINLVNPLARVVKFSIKTQELKETMEAPSKEGLTVKMEVSVLFHLNPEAAPQVYQGVGEDYVEIILRPQFRSVCRGVTARFDAKALYTSEREQLAQLLTEELRALTEARGVVVESTPLRQVGLPAGLSASIEQKLQAEQESQRMQFVLTKEQQEADRKRIEAQGIADFQAIVAQGISDPLLRWKGIEATLKIAESQNAKVVIIGSGKDGLPIILDTK